MIPNSGAVPPGMAAAAPDRSVTELLERQSRLEPLVGGHGGPAEDPYRSAGVAATRRAPPGSLLIGRVVHPLPLYHWYKVQPWEGGAALRACALSPHGLTPVGPRGTGALPADATVLLYRAPGLPCAVILGVVPDLAPPPGPDGGTPAGPLRGWIAQHGASGGLREPLDRAVVDLMTRGGGVVDFAGGRPADATPYDAGCLAETGVGWNVSPFAAFFRAAENCGLFVSLIDFHARLAGRNLLVESGMHEEEWTLDEGEPRYYRGEAAYPWEALGLYAPADAAAWDSAEAAAVLYDGHRAKLDLPPGQEARQPFHRYREYGGYLGQGRQAFVALPPAAAGPRVAGDGGLDVGVLHEARLLDGSYLLRSARGVFLGKGRVFAAPRPRRDPADQSDAADGGAAAPYRFAGRFGEGPAHRAGPLAAPAERPDLCRLAGIAELATYAFRWQATHALHYHGGDFDRPDEGTLPAAEPLDFMALGRADRVPPPTPRRLRVDHRGEADYTDRESLLAMTEDGSVVLDGGAGERLAFCGGNVQLEAPGDIRLVAGRRVVILAREVVVRARDAVDVSSAAGAVRLKADAEMQLLAGNSGAGGVLIESRAAAPDHDYADRYGTDVASSGVVLRAPFSDVAALGGDIYLRTGGGDARAGDITLDAAGGAARVSLLASGVACAGPGGLSVFVAPAGSAEVSVAHHLGPGGVILGADASVSGQLCVSGGVVAEGSVSAAGTIAAAGGLASGQGGPAAQVDGNFESDLRRVVAANAEQATAAPAAGGEAVRALRGRYYEDGRAIGSDRVLAAIGFSFRDPPGIPSQYGTAGLEMAEPRWVQLGRLGGAAGGAAWDEPPVEAHGQPTYPWPGRVAWEESGSVARAPSLPLSGPAAGRPAPRGPAYEDAAVPAVELVPMKEALRVIPPEVS